MTEMETIEAALPAVRDEQALMARSEITVTELLAQSAMIEQAMSLAMREGHHYGKVPGVSKPTLLKPGAEKLCVLFRLAPSYESEKIWHPDGHLTVSVVCSLTHIHSGMVVGGGEGLCSTRESKYAWRQGKRRCPDCGAEAIVRSTRKNAYFCISKEGGCGSRFAFGTDPAKALDAADVSRVPNPDLADTYNTVLKMADKRALVAAVLNATAASDMFTQDVEEAAAPAEPEQPEEPRAFNPAVDVLDSAPTWRNVVDFLLGMDSERGNWSAWWDQAAYALTGEPGSWQEIEKTMAEPARVSWRKRLVNAAGRLNEIIEGRTFPPPSREECQQAFAFAFDGHLLPGPPGAMSPEEAAMLMDAEAAEAAEADVAVVEPTEGEQAAMEAEEVAALADESFDGGEK